MVQLAHELCWLGGQDGNYSISYHTWKRTEEFFNPLDVTHFNS